MCRLAEGDGNASLKKEILYFRRGMSLMDYVAFVVSDIRQRFSRGVCMLALALDIKGAFNRVRPDILNQKLIKLEVSERMMKFVISITEFRSLSFDDSSLARLLGVGVPQGGVLSSVLFNLYLHDMGESLIKGVRITQYADDVFLYFAGEDPDVLNAHMQRDELAIGSQN